MSINPIIAIIGVRPAFPLGKLVMTIGVNNRVAQDAGFAAFVCTSLKRHATKDWGDLDKEDWEENELSLREGFRLFSVYSLEAAKIYIITERDRSVTTILFPEEY